MRNALGILLLSLLILQGCSVNTISGNEVMASILDVDESATSYYMKTAYEGYENKPFTMKEWRMADGRYRVEMYEGETLAFESVFSGDNHVMVDYEEEQILVYDATETAEYWTRSPKGSMTQMLHAMHDHYDITVREEKEVLGREVFVLDMKSRNMEKDEMEIWVDKENWVILKMDFKFEEDWMTSEAIEFELRPKVDAELFTVDESLDFDELSLGEISSNETIDLEEAKRQASFSFLTPIDGYQVHEASTYPRQDDEVGINLTYSDEEGKILFSYEFFKRSDPLVKVFGNEQEIKIRKTEGLMIWDETLNMVAWQEDGIQYSFYPEAPLTKDEVVEIIEEMKVVEEN